MEFIQRTTVYSKWKPGSSKLAENPQNKSQ